MRVTGISTVYVTGSSGLCPREELVSQAAQAGQKSQANVIVSNVQLTNMLLLPDAIYHHTHTFLTAPQCQT